MHPKVHWEYFEDGGILVECVDSSMLTTRDRYEQLSHIITSNDSEVKSSMYLW